MGSVSPSADRAPLGASFMLLKWVASGPKKRKLFFGFIFSFSLKRGQCLWVTPEGMGTRSGKLVKTF